MRTDLTDCIAHLTGGLDIGYSKRANGELGRKLPGDIEESKHVYRYYSSHQRKEFKGILNRFTVWD